MSGTLRKKLKTEMRTFLEGVVAVNGNLASRKQILKFATSNNLTFEWYKFNYPFKSFKVKRGLYDLKAILDADDSFDTTNRSDTTSTSLDSATSM